MSIVLAWRCWCFLQAVKGFPNRVLNRIRTSAKYDDASTQNKKAFPGSPVHHLNLHLDLFILIEIKWEIVVGLGCIARINALFRPEADN